MDIDIFTAKRRNKKFDDDDVVQQEDLAPQRAVDRFSMDSAHKMIVEPVRNIDQDSSSRKLVDAKYAARN